MIQMQQNMRWYGRHDTVNLQDIRESGVSGVVTALHQIAVGDIWPIAAIKQRQAAIREAGMEWTVVESLPVHEDIKRQAGKYETYIANYKQSLSHLAECGIRVITYNFMPVLDWVRTHHLYANPDGTKTLQFHWTAFVYFDLFLLQRPQAKKDYSPAEIEQAVAYGNSLSETEQKQLFRNILLGLPGSTEDFTREQILELLAGYAAVDDTKLRENLLYFLKEVTPTAEALGVKLALHPDDPPFSVMGLPRVVSTSEDLDTIFSSVPQISNGLCYCTGSLGALESNDLLSILDKHGSRIHFLHLRNVVRENNRVFRESEHLHGDNPMEAIMEKLLLLMKKRKISLPMRPDHGFLHSLEGGKVHYAGYSLIGRLKGLAELRGLEMGVAYHLNKNQN